MAVSYYISLNNGNCGVSQLVHTLREFAWIPQGDGVFEIPCNAVRERLPEGFPIDTADNAWLEAVGFEQNRERNAAKTPSPGTENEEAQRKEAERKRLAEELGFRSEEVLEEAQWFAELAPEVRERIRRSEEARASPPPPMPGSDDPPGEDREVRARFDAAQDQDKSKERRLRTTYPGRGEAKGEAEQYLRALYTDEEGTMVCQVCRSALPFRLANGKHYFERVELLRSMGKLHRQNFLALCPNHSAMFLYALDTGEEEIARQLTTPGLETLDVAVTLAGEAATIAFNPKHRVDLRAMLQAEAAEQPAGLPSA